jgi:ABC-type multidrug transport system fused ATPase/permease subunit
MSSPQLIALCLASVIAIAFMANKYRHLLARQQKEIDRLNRVIEEKASDVQMLQALQRESY